MKRSVLFVSMFVIAILLVGCGPWNYNAACVSKVGDSTGCVDAGAPANAWLQMNGYLTPVVNVNVSVPTQPAPIVNVAVPSQQAPVVNIVVSTPAPLPVVPTVAPVVIPTVVAPATVSAPTATDHIKRLVELDKIYRNQGLEPWLRAAGFTWDGAVQQARQVEEETVQVDGLPKIVVSGVQLVATNFHAPYPACMTTDKPFTLDTTGRSFKPDPNNASVLVTNGIVSNTLTAYVDCSNWAQLAPR